MNSTALIKLNGTIIKSDGTESKSSYFDFLALRPDDYSDIAFSPEEARRIKSHLRFLSTGSAAAIPLRCGGPAVCPFAEQCPFVREDRTRRAADASAKLVTPVGRACLVELNLMDEWTSLYVEEYDIDPKNFTEFSMVRELAEIELMLWRLNNNLAKPENASLVMEQTVGVDKNGDTLSRLEVSAFVEAKERYNNRKSRIIKLMVGDRQEKYKREAALKIKEESDPSISAARLRNEIGRLLSQAKQLDIQLEEKQKNTIEIDEGTPSDDISPDDLINGS